MITIKRLRKIPFSTVGAAEFPKGHSNHDVQITLNAVNKVLTENPGKIPLPSLPP